MIHRPFKDMTVEEIQELFKPLHISKESAQKVKSLKDYRPIKPYKIATYDWHHDVFRLIRLAPELFKGIEFFDEFDEEDV